MGLMSIFTMEATRRNGETPLRLGMEATLREAVGGLATSALSGTSFYFR